MTEATMCSADACDLPLHFALDDLHCSGLGLVKPPCQQRADCWCKANATTTTTTTTTTAAPEPPSDGFAARLTWMQITLTLMGVGSCLGVRLKQPIYIGGD